MKKTYTPSEFAALFGREKTWTYRLLYKGKIEGITEYGRMMIPAREADRIEADSARYRGKKSVKKAPEKVGPLPAETASSGAGRWKDWVSARKFAGHKTSGLRRKGRAVPGKPTASK